MAYFLSLVFESLACRALVSLSSSSILSNTPTGDGGIRTGDDPPGQIILHASHTTTLASIPFPCSWFKTHAVISGYREAIIGGEGYQPGGLETASPGPSLLVGLYGRLQSHTLLAVTVRSCWALGCECALALTARLDDLAPSSDVRRRGKDDIDTEFAKRGCGGFKHGGHR